MERLTEELGKLQGDLERQEALVSQRDGMIAELRDDAYTQWASSWLAFQHMASRAFQDSKFNFQLSDEEAEESVFEVDADAEVLSGAFDHAPLPDDLWVPLEASSPALPAGALCRPKPGGSVDNPSTRGILVDVGLLDTTHENRTESPLYGELYPRYNLSQ